MVAVEPPAMVTMVPDCPPLQVTLTPCVRVTAATCAWLVQTNAVGSVRLVLKCWTSLPPGPLSNVKVPPELGMKLADTVPLGGK